MDNTLYIDNREPIKKWFHFKILDRTYSKVDQLKYKISYSQIEKGDYLYNNVMIHRKTIGDFDSSYLNEHIKQEMYDLHLWVAEDLNNVGHLIVVGESNTNNVWTGWQNRERLGAVASLEADFGIPITFVNNEGDFNILCHALFRKFRPGFTSFLRPFDVFRYKSKEMRALSLEERFFKLLPDIDKVRSRIIGQIEGLNIRVFVGDEPLSYDHLLDLEHIGPKTIEKIFKILEPDNCDGNIKRYTKTKKKASG